MGDTSYGVRSILDQAREFAECSKLYPCLFQTPTVLFIFANGVGCNLATKIELCGIQVEGERVEDSFFDENELDQNDNDKDEDSNYVALSTINAANIKKVNLDVSAMLAYCSSVTNGSAGKYKFDVAVLAQQAEWELLRPQKPILDNFFQGKKLYCCETAKRNFINIVNTVGGSNERLRAAEFLERVIVLPDDASTEDTDDAEVKEIFNNVQYSIDKALNVGGKIRERSLIIFSFGDRIQAVTVTANEGFVRAAKQQGINFVVFLHESRALTEQKEQAKGSIL
ncbi:hypothetical protein HHI36_013464 [Cryptolaemus montrouzieri]|uniref:DUF1308 domain-containing protein n=1 Tax=Cryptolaemus montrouzieri TaxID=559131 RepID=A0ABD2NHV4_9CUCU